MSKSVPVSPLSILLVFGEIERGTTLQRAGLELVARLREHGFTVLAARSASDGIAAIRADPLIGAVLVDSELDESGGAAAVLSAFRARNDRAPAFLLGERSHISEIPLQTLRLANEFVWLTEDTSTLIAGRIEAALQRYRENLLPPMFASMLSPANVHEWVWLP